MKVMTRAVIAVLILALAGMAASAPQVAPGAVPTLTDLRARVQVALDDVRATATFPGVGVGIAFADGESFGVASGLADVAQRVALTPTDRLLAGSVGKTFVAAVVLQLIEEGTLALDDRAATWVGDEPWFARVPNAPALTVRSLLNHTAGLPEYYDGKGAAEAITADPHRVWAPAGRLAYVLDAAPLFPVGQGWSYADTHYILLGLIAERAGRTPLFTQIERRLLAPLALRGIIASDRRDVPRLAVGYADPKNPLGLDGRTVIDGRLTINPQVEWAGGGLATTPQDLARWATLLFEGKTFRRKETLAAMLVGVDTTAGRGGAQGPTYGLGVMIRDTAWGPSYGHSGWFPGYRTELAYFPDRQVAIAVQFNTDIATSLRKAPSTYLDDLARVVLGPGK